MNQESMESGVQARPYADFAERLVIAMRDKRIKGSQLAVMLRKADDPHDQLTPQAVSKWTTGKGLPDEYRTDRLCELLGVEKSWLLGAHKPPKPGRKSLVSPRTALRGYKPLIDAVYATKDMAAAIKKVSEMGDEQRYAEYGLEGFQDPNTAIGREAAKLAKAREDSWVAERRSKGEIRAALLVFTASACSKQRSTLIVDEFRMIRGPYYRMPVDIVVSEDDQIGSNTLKFGVLVRYGTSRDRLAALIGDTLNWNLATKGRPLHVIWVTPPRPEPELTELNAGLQEQLSELVSPKAALDIGHLISGFTIVPSENVGLQIGVATSNLENMIKAL